MLAILLVAVAWIYVALMMAVAEAMHTNGTVLGALVTFFFYGVFPLAVVLYLLGTPMRRKARRAAEAAAGAAAPAEPQAVEPEAVAPTTPADPQRPG